MVDLVTTFFERELSEAEADALGNLLQQSPEEALRYEGLLEQHYLATGLPAPQVPQSLTLPPSSGGLGASGWTGLAVVIALTGAGLLWKFWPQVPAEVPVKPVIAPVKVAAPRNPIPSVPVQPAPVQPAPVEATAEGEELSVVVSTQAKSLVTVRILDSTGREVRGLFAGFVQPGQWAFKWDGELFNGVPAPAGEYQIDVQTGSLHQFKTIRIK
jgi:hypothetical protein